MALEGAWNSDRLLRMHTVRFSSALRSRVHNNHILLHALMAAASAILLAAGGSCGTAAAGASSPPPALERKFHQYLRQHWSLEEGLPQVGVGDLAQDAQGFLWIATQDGLARFDGVEFQVFKTDGAPGLAGNNIVKLALDDNGTLWIGTRTGLSRFDGTSFAEVRSAGGGLGTIHGLAAANGGMLIASDSGLFRATGTAVERVPGVPEQRVFFASPEPGGGILIGHSGAVRQIGPSGRRDYSLAAYGDGVIPKLCLRGCGGAWVATTVGLFRLNGSGLSPFKPLAHRNVNDLYCDPAGTLWVGTGNGLYRIRDNRVIESVEDEARLPHTFVTAFLRGSDGGLWIGTLTGGLYRLTEGRYIRYNKLDGLPFAATWAVQESRSSGLWVGGQGGVARLRNGHFEPAPGAGSLEAEQVVAALLEDSNGRLWTGTRTGLIWTNIATGRTVRILEDMVLALAEAPDGSIWIGGLSGLRSFHAGRLERHGEQEGIARVRNLLVSARYGLVVGTEQGVFVTSSGARIFERFDAPVFGEGRRAGALFEEENGDLWVGYLGDGLARYVAARAAWSLYTERDGLLSNTVSGVRVGRDGRIWIATQKGVLRIERPAFDKVDRRTAQAPTAEAAARARPPAHTDSASGLNPDVVVSITGREVGSSPGYCCNGGSGSSVLLVSDGSLWVPTLDGILQIDTNQVLAERPAPPTALVSMRHGSRLRMYDRGQSVQVPAAERDIEFVFTAPTFDQPGLMRFRYRLDGYDGEWKEARGRRSASYTNLPAGSYRFRVRAETGNPTRDGTEASWSFTILPRFTETWWFYGLLIPAVLGAAYGTHALRLRRLEQQRTRLEQLVAERTTQLKDANEELGRVNRRLQEQSYTDPLTQLWNRRYLSDHIERDLAQVLRLREKTGAEDLAIVFMMIDIDHFKEINDLHGHEAGDSVLAETARRLKGIARSTDYVVRWGGEEFLLVVCFSPAATAPRVAERVMGALWSDPFPLTGKSPLVVRGSVGFSVFPFTPWEASGNRPDPRSWQNVINLADHALYTVKQGGRNGWAGILPASRFDPAVSMQDLARDVDARITSGEVEIITSMRGKSLL